MSVFLTAGSNPSTPPPPKNKINKNPNPEEEEPPLSSLTVGGNFTCWSSNGFNSTSERVYQGQTDGCCWRYLLRVWKNHRPVRASARTAGHHLEPRVKAPADRWVRLCDWSVFEPREREREGGGELTASSGRAERLTDEDLRARRTN